MDEAPILTSTPVSTSSTLLQNKFYDQFAAQSEQMDKLGAQLITLELAIPGLYATVLKLLQGDDATIAADNWFYFTFVCWFFALLLTLISLVPRIYDVDPTIIKNVAGSNAAKMSVEDFFFKSARYKRRLLIPSIHLFWAGIFGAAITIF